MGFNSGLKGLITTILWTVFYYLISRQKMVETQGNNFMAVAYIKQRIIYFNELTTLLHYLQQEPTGCPIYFQFISIINLYMFRAGLLRIIRRYYSVYTTTGICHAFILTGCWQDRNGSCQQPVNINA
jgi:hypothetical protein